MKVLTACHLKTEKHCSPPGEMGMKAYQQSAVVGKQEKKLIACGPRDVSIPEQKAVFIEILKPAVAFCLLFRHGKSKSPPGLRAMLM